jgi:hypothetical protein
MVSSSGRKTVRNLDHGTSSGMIITKEGVAVAGDSAIEDTEML